MTDRRAAKSSEIYSDDKGSPPFLSGKGAEEGRGTQIDASLNGASESCGIAVQDETAHEGQVRIADRGAQPQQTASGGRSPDHRQSDAPT
ncbi:hypothetical protein C7408_118119 [Paraburkholderia caballeronis]|nr:hypothetical protein C7408_118119 [Paraburkholderia caballeronis]TDV11811.1 hypothetical protein C7406_1198 [Paraburkholderia caballeronis]TDV18119.1 hypothetical protein C7404_13331 [Paraburkholderia caballeronis]